MSEPDLRSLRHTLARRLRQKAELEERVRAAQAQFEESVAPLQEEVLRLQKERLKKAAQVRMRSARLRNAYHDAEDAYEAFRDRRPSEDEQTAPNADLKDIYRRATKLCHPDAVDASYREEATATFRALESAFDAEHPRAVQAIADALETWGFPRAPEAPPDTSVSDVEAALQRAVAALGASIERLRTSEAYEVLTDTDAADVDSVMQARRRALRERLATLRSQSSPNL